MTTPSTLFREATGREIMDSISSLCWPSFRDLDERLSTGFRNSVHTAGTLQWATLGGGNSHHELSLLVAILVV